MKFLKYLRVFIPLVMLFIMSCSKDNPGNGGPAPSSNNNVASGSFFAIIPGAEIFNTTNIKAEMQENILTIEAIQGKAVFGILLFSPKVGENKVGGTFPKSGDLYHNLIIYEPDTTKRYYYTGNDAATINVTSYDPVAKTIAGTFSLVMQDSLGKTINVSGGKFNIHYTFKGGSMSYTIDGVNYTNYISAYTAYTIQYDSLHSRDSIPLLDVVSSSNINGSGNQYPRIDFEIPRNLGVGNYSIGNGNSSLIKLKYFNATLYLSQNNNYYSRNVGTLSITQNDMAGHRMVGTFAFTLTCSCDTVSGQNSKTKQITNGSFDVTYQ